MKDPIPTPSSEDDRQPAQQRPAPTSTLDAPAAPARSFLSRLLPFLERRGLEPGDRLPSERDLAKRFDVARSIVREGLAVLEALRIVECRPQSGVYLRRLQRDAGLDALLLFQDAGLPLSADDVRDLYEFRTFLELQAIVAAARRRDAADMARIDAVINESRDRLARGLSLAEQDAAFHLALIEATHNQLLVRAANSFYLVSGERARHYFADPEHGRRSLAQHEALAEAVRDGDAPRADALMRRHLQGVERYWLTELDATTTQQQRAVDAARQPRSRGPGSDGPG